MASASTVPVEVYLQTVFRPDCDYVDGEILERTLGELPHGRLQTFLVKLFGRHEDQWNLEIVSEVRVQVAPSSFRVSDLAVLPFGSPDSLILHTPPALCIEIFSSDDRMSRMQERVADFRRMGVAVVWVLDPWRRVAYTGKLDGRLTPEEEALTLPATPVRVTVAEVWAELDRLAQRSQAR